MSIKQLITMEPTKIKVDSKGNHIPVYRAGIKDTNRYAKKTPMEKSMEANMGKRDYKPPVSEAIIDFKTNAELDNRVSPSAQAQLYQAMHDITYRRRTWWQRVWDFLNTPI